MLKRILLVWFVANFLIAGVAALLTGGWYLRLPTLVGMVAEIGLIILPNLLFPIFLLRYAWPIPLGSLQKGLGWQWSGWRPIWVGMIAFVIYLLLSIPLSNIIGPSIPYSLPGEGGPITGLAGLLVLFLFVLFVVVTIVGEETMFRGLIQTQVSEHSGVWAGILLTILLFGLRHLPADIFYSQIWNATPQMWAARQVDLYLGAGLLSLARYLGRSTYASATMHLLIFLFIFVQGFI
jgi:membrane protease YdiL (CAAX protease family)